MPKLIWRTAHQSSPDYSRVVIKHPLSRPTLTTLLHPSHELSFCGNDAPQLFLVGHGRVSNVVGLRTFMHGKAYAKAVSE